MKISALWLVAVALPVLSGPPAFAEDAFGGSSQDLWIPAQAFMPMTAGESLVYGLGDFYLTVAPPLTTGTFSAPVTLEAGARIRRVECDFFAAVQAEAHVHFRRQLKPPGDAPPLNADLLHFHTATGAAEYVEVGMDIDHTYQTRVGTATALYVLDLIMSNDGGNNLRFRGCRVAWNRQVSPAPSLATFSDVPTSHPLHRFVEALVAAGITGGCSASQYCPDAPLTRGQMAVFLSVALGLHFPY